MTNNSKVLALKYRPQVPEDLIGQEVVIETILNGIKSKKTPNAYLFTGIRGVGKTTIARIIAKALNCKNGIDNLCKEKFCENCSSIINSNHIDVLEMDAASKTGVDDVRDLIEFSRYGPTSAQYKIFIIDEVHMLSKQAFNALLKTLEEPPNYLKFIFATTEIKKIPVTVVSRCQRYDLSRIKSDQLFDFLKDVAKKEKGLISDEALKLIVKISEGSVRDSLSLLDRGLMSNINGSEFTLENAQKIYGYFDKSFLIELIEYLLKGDEKNVIKNYRKLFDAGIEPKSFLNDFLEVLYYIKNINSIRLEGKIFNLNDGEFKKILEIAEKTDPQEIILFWQFTIKTIDELEIVSNPNLSVEMFLVRLIYLKGYKIKEDINNESLISSIEKETVKIDKTVETVNQIKNVSQEDKIDPKLETNKKKTEISSFRELINLCNERKEMKLKYELETNVNLVSFENFRMEISFNDNLDKDFIKELSHKLFEWTGSRWIITLSQKKGEISTKEKDQINQRQIFEQVKKSDIYKKVLEILPDAELIDVKKIDKESND
ncbi:DNA polymerase III subunit gamma/tau [Candidatus Pelagibacter sp. RS40]|uniref:DNA polymerase III subunit gamma/tau n=1 Tax=Candidatus Pelagibacter sp. RS40 TaxID=1977865 RepID=UPI000A14E421|nr:DNA polymerase III subunit gamma/tau [Candidatus Pelagibacter sp. RS40]ARJ49209.1 DNA polymerase III, subunit gamma and tau [Candidatus Pelagibacter sp. RS40]